MATYRRFEELNGKTLRRDDEVEFENEDDRNWFALRWA